MACPVCKTECFGGVLCPECGFKQVSFNSEQWGDLEIWFEEVVKPYREQYLRQKFSSFYIQNWILKKYIGKDSVVKIPYGVTAIGTEAFSGNSAITEVYLPATVKEIGKHAFSSCENVKIIHLPEGVRSIRYGAFECCDNLSFTLPNSVTDIEDGFCIGAVKISVKEDNPRYRVQDSCLIDIQQRRLLHCWSDNSTVMIPAVVKYIATAALPEVGIPDRVIIVPEGVERIDGDIGGEIRRIELPATIKYIEEGSLRNVHRILISNDNPYYECRGFCIIEKETKTVVALKDKRARQCTIPPDVKRIGDYAFSGGYRLNWIVLPHSIEYVGYAAFQLCESLDQIFCECDDISGKWHRWWNLCCTATVYWEKQWFYKPIPYA